MYGKYNFICRASWEPICMESAACALWFCQKMLKYLEKSFKDDSNKLNKLRQNDLLNFCCMFVGIFGVLSRINFRFVEFILILF